MNISVTLNSSGISLSAPAVGGAQTGISGIIVSNTTYTSGTVSFSNANGITWGSSAGQAITASYNSTQFAGTGTSITGNASITLNSNGIAFNGSNLAGVNTGATNATITVNSSGISVSVAAPSAALIALSGGAGTSNSVSGLTFANSNGITFGLSTGASVGTMTASYNSTQFAGTGTSITGNASITLNSNGIAFNGSGLAGTATAITGSLSITHNSAGLSFNGSNLAGNNTAKSGAIAFTVNSSGISINATSLAGTGTAVTGNLSMTLNTTGLSFNGSNLAGTSSAVTGNLSITHNTSGLAINASNLAGTATAITGNASITLNTTGLSFNGSGLAGTVQAQPTHVTVNSSGVSVSVLAQTNQNNSLYALGNTTQNSSTVLNASVLSFNGLGGQTVGFSNGSIQLSVPVTSSLSATGLASSPSNGSTISVGAAIVQLSFFQPLGAIQTTTATQIGNGSVLVYPAIAAFPFTATRVDMMATVSAAALAASTEAQTLSMYVGLYSLNGSTLSLASSGSQSYAWTNSSGGSSSVLTGLRRFSAPMNVNYTGGFDLFVGIMSNTTFVNTNGISLSNIAVPIAPPIVLNGLMGETTNSTRQFVPGQGYWSTTSAALPGSIGISQIYGIGSGSNSAYAVPVQFANVTA